MCPGRLQVVVEDDSTAKDLLSKGQLQRRTTIIPLNKVRTHHSPEGQRDPKALFPA